MRTPYEMGRNDALQKHGIDLGSLAMTAAPYVVGAKAGIMAHNQFLRHGHKIPGVQRLGQEIAGLGLRTGQQGKPMLSSPMRNALATFDNGMMTAYERGHAAGAGTRGMSAVPGQTQLAQRQVGEAARSLPGFQSTAKFIEGIPTESTGWRKALDYGFTPVSQVGRDIRNQGQRFMAGAKGILTPT